MAKKKKFHLLKGDIFISQIGDFFYFWNNEAKHSNGRKLENFLSKKERDLSELKISFAICRGRIELTLPVSQEVLKALSPKLTDNCLFLERLNGNKAEIEIDFKGSHTIVVSARKEHGAEVLGGKLKWKPLLSK